MRQIWLYFSFNFYFVIFSCTQTGRQAHTRTDSLPGREPRWAVFVLEHAACCLWQRCRRQRPQRPFAAILRSLWQHFGSKANDADNVHDSNGRGKTKKKCYCVVCGSLCSIRNWEREEATAAAATAKKSFQAETTREMHKTPSRLAVSFLTTTCTRLCVPVCICVCASLCVCVTVFAYIRFVDWQLSSPVHSHPLVIDCNMSVLVCSSLALLSLLLLLLLLFGNNFLTLC